MNDSEFKNQLLWRKIETAVTHSKNISGESMKSLGEQVKCQVENEQSTLFVFTDY